MSKQLDYVTYKIRLHHIQNIQTQNQYSARMKGVKSRVLSFLLMQQYWRRRQFQMGDYSRYQLFYLQNCTEIHLVCMVVYKFYRDVL